MRQVRQEAEALQPGVCVWVCARDGMTEKLKFPSETEIIACASIVRKKKEIGSFPAVVLRGWSELSGF